MKRIFIYFSIWFALIYLINGYVSYYHFRFILPDDLFRYPYRELSKSEVVAWKFVLQWVIPAIFSVAFIYLSNLHKRVVFNWGGCSCWDSHFDNSMQIPFVLFGRTNTWGWRTVRG